MTEERKELEVKKEEAITPDEGERTRECPVFVPRADIFETEDEVTVVADMPGVDENAVDITLEKSTLTIRGFIDQEIPEGYAQSYAEYGIGDYERSFVLSNEIDREKIEASVKDGVLRLRLPKLDVAKARKIKVKTS